jgi:hypothetical protein
MTLCFYFFSIENGRHFRLAKGVSLESANIVFDKAVQKVIKDTVKHALLVSTALYYSQALYHSL